MLTLSEKLLLLGLHDEKGSVVLSASMALPYGLVAALLLELYLANRIDLIEDKIIIVDGDKSNNQLLDEVLELLSSSEKLRTVEQWLSIIESKVKKIQPRLAEQLVEKEILSEQKHSLLWLINYTRYPTKDTHPETELRSRLQNIVLKDFDANEEDIALLSLIQVCELVGEVFDKEDKKQAQKRIGKITKDGRIEQAISKTVGQITAALVSIFVTVAITTTVVT